MMIRKPWSLTCSGFTLIELIIIIVVLGILAAFSIVKYSDFLQESKIAATRSEMATIKRAIVGNPQIIAGGHYIDVGFAGNVGHPPAQLLELVRKPDTISAYNVISRLGWNGPYLDSAGNDYLKDAWGMNYVYNQAARTITSTGSGASIVVGF
jgi:prepilin-type N-terminal cleavage/methylation domain-containing protein